MKQAAFSIESVAKRRAGRRVDLLLDDQGGLCFYCLLPPGDPVWNVRKGVWVETRAELDHVIPRAHRPHQSKSSGVVASCSVCNQITSDKVFDTIEEARRFVVEERLRRGYRESKPGSARRPELAISRCLQCGEPFKPYKRKVNHQKFCSQRCRQAAWEQAHPRLPLYPPATRKTDPSSSRRAEAGVTASGERATHVEIVAGLVRANPGETCHEITERCALDYHEVMRRLNDAYSVGRVLRGDKRKCRVGGKRVLTWWPA